MLPVKKALHLGLLLVVLGSTAVVNQAIAALTIEVPVSASNTLISGAVTAAVTSTELTTMRNLVADTTILTQSEIIYDPVTGEQTNLLPMQNILQPLMQGAIMKPMMDSLANPDNPLGAVYLFAPDFVIPPPLP